MKNLIIEISQLINRSKNGLTTMSLKKIISTNLQQTKNLLFEKYIHASEK